YDVCRRALTPADPGRREAMRPVLDAWVQIIAVARAAGVPVIYTTPVSRADGADVIMLPTDLSAETGVPPLTNGIEGTAEAGFPDEIAPQPEDYVFLKRRPSAFYGTGVAELLHMLRRDTILIGGGATNRGVATSGSERRVVHETAGEGRVHPVHTKRSAQVCACWTSLVSERRRTETRFSAAAAR